MQQHSDLRLEKSRAGNIPLISATLWVMIDPYPVPYLREFFRARRDACCQEIVRRKTDDGIFECLYLWLL